uniref:Uncharacterized protein n=1 Tax=Tanacetum cinerariifolium TaxID=118510 RepID=A0A699GYJ0_TANCI|nr:hypothetical protein [Tanacetum cinerariifolium]
MELITLQDLCCSSSPLKFDFYGSVLVFVDTAYWILFPLWSSVRCMHRYDVSSLMDTAYWLSEQTVRKVPDIEDTIKFMLDTKEFTYTVDIFRVTLHLPVETPENLFKFPDIPQRVDKDYRFIKDDTPLISVYTTGNVLVRGMLIPDAFLTEEICATNDFKEYEMVFVGVDVPMNQLQLVVSTQGTHMSTPRAHRTPTISTASPLGKKRE